MCGTIIFHDNNLTLRGTSVALYDYADFYEKILGGKSIVIAKPDDNLNKAKTKFTSRFETYFGWWNDKELDDLMSYHKADYFYSIRAGLSSDGPIPTKYPSLIHSVFCHNDPHGSQYAYVSDWLARNQGYDTETHSVPHIVNNLPDSQYNLRDRLSIPKDSLVFGYYGGSKEFNIAFVHRTIKKIINERSDIYFIFMNIESFTDPHPNIIHLPGTYDLHEKSSFIDACDAMIHARMSGETFGLACAEFSLKNKPVITYKLSSEANHIETLKDRGVYYTDKENLYDILNYFYTYKKYNDYYIPYLVNNPADIMNKFQKVFLS